MIGFNFRAYLRNYEILQVIGKNKTRKQFKNFLRVLYGKKKDRGFIKPKVEKTNSRKRKYRRKDIWCYIETSSYNRIRFLLVKE